MSNLFVGILIYQFIQLCIIIIAILINKYNDDLLYIILCYTNIFYILCATFIYFYKNIKLFYQKHNYNLYKIYNNDNHYIDCCYIKEKYVKRFLKKTDREFYIDFSESGKCIKSIIPNYMIFNYKDIKEFLNLKEN